MRQALLGLGILLALAGCMSGGGPSAGAMKATADVTVVHMTPALAQTEQDELAVAQKRDLQRIVNELDVPFRPFAPPLGPGAKITVTLWNYAPRPEITGPAPTPLGTFIVAADGAVSLPYLRRVSLAGLSREQAQDTLTQKYAALGLFQKPSILLDVNAAPTGQVIVTGAVGQPHILSWRPEGLTLAQALTESLGDGAAILAQEGAGPGQTAVASVAVFRGDAAPAELPIFTALEQNIALQPGDRVIVKESPAVEVTVLGPGIQNSGIYAFGHIPTLSEVLARGSGLNANTANDRAVFLLREVRGDRPVLYDFAWDKVQGVVASHRFPVRHGDLVYVAEAGIVPIQRVVNLLFQVAVPAQLAK